MSMRVREKLHKQLYPRWSKKDSPAKRAKLRDGQHCVSCGVADRTLITDELGQPHHIVYLHGAHLCLLDPQYALVEPIGGQRLISLCPTCHGSYDAIWKPRMEETEHQQRLHAIALNRTLPGHPWLTKRFLEVV